jgi:hypothetical protein
VDDHGSRPDEAGHGPGRDLLEAEESFTQQTQDLCCPTGVDQVLAVQSGCMADDQERYRRVSFDHLRHGKPMCQAHQAGVLAIGSL